MLISLLAVLEFAEANTPIVLEGPSTLELALIGAGILIVYAIVSRANDRRRARIIGARAVDPSTFAAGPVSPAETGTEQEPSRGAA